MTSRHDITRVRVAGVVIEDDRILLIAHKKDGNVYWLLPGGGVDYGESLEEALKREFSEELSIPVDVGEVAFISDSIDPKGSRHIINICFYCTLVDSNIVLGNDAILHDVAFFTQVEIAHIPMFPPVNIHLQALMKHESNTVYKGKIWQDR